MVSDMLNKVLQKEQQTAESEQSARAEAEKIIASAENEAKAIIEKAARERFGYAYPDEEIYREIK